MKENKVDKNSLSVYGPLQRKTFAAALDYFFSEQCPHYGALARAALVSNVERLVNRYYPSNSHMRMGQVMWPAIDEKETAGYGKPIEKSKLTPVFVDLITAGDIQKLADAKKRREIKKEVSVRLFNQAKEQGGVLTYVDVASIMNLSTATIGQYVREYEKENKTLVPRRGTIHDMGRTLTHKREICKKIIVEGKSVEQTAKETNHSPEAITRYVKDYKRIAVCLSKGLSVDTIAFAVKASKKLIFEYMDLIEEYNVDPLEDIGF